SYTYALKHRQEHDRSSGTDDTLFDEFTVVLTDTDGDQTSDTLSVAIIDDAPTVETDSSKMDHALVDEAALGTSATADFSDVFTINAGADGHKSNKSIEYSLALRDGD